MNTTTKALLLLAVVAISSCSVIEENLANLKAMMQNTSATAAANAAKLQSMMNSLQNATNNSSAQQNNNQSNGNSNGSSQQNNSTPVANNTAPVANNTAPVANNTTPVANNTTPVANNTTPVANNNTAPVSNNSAPASNNTSAGGLTVTLDQLETIMPNSGNNSAYYLSYINDAMSSGAINNCARVAAFLAQIGHESGSLVYTTEIADGSAYEGIADIGNTSPGDGVKYKGRGFIQVTGKYNYQIVSQGLGYDFVSDPEALATVPYCATSAVWWWNNHSLSTIADANTQDSFDQITRIINGGYNGKADRDSRWATAKQVLGC